VHPNVRAYWADPSEQAQLMATGEVLVSWSWNDGVTLLKEEGYPVGAIGNHLSAYIMENAFDDLDAPVINCTGKDVPMPYAANLEKLALVTSADVVNAVKSVCYR